MKAYPARIQTPQFLSGWKEIANYLGKGVRTVQRYEREFGLPVRRPAGKPSGSVIATKAEIDGWVTASPIREVYRLSSNDGASGSANMTAAMKQGLAQMHLLREQMTEIRAEVKKSAQILQANLYELRAGLDVNFLEGSAPLRILKGTDALSKTEVNLLRSTLNNQKAS